MIPVQLALKNFLSYSEANLDFRGLHTVCICGSNGAGKSSLLEAITWAIWGQSRAGIEDDVIHAGAKEARVNFTFQMSLMQTYRVIRSHPRGGTSVLELQVETPDGFRAITAKGLRATQELILQHIKLDYDTFVNSAYLRQGRADEFMVKRPSDRKQILAELLKLNQYDDLEESSKDLSRHFKIRAEESSRLLAEMKERLQEREEISQQKQDLAQELNQLQQLQELDQTKLQNLLVIQHQRKTWVEQLEFVYKQHQGLFHDKERLKKEKSSLQIQLDQMEEILQQKTEIEVGYSQYQQLQSQEEVLAAKFENFTHWQELKQQKQQELDQDFKVLEQELQEARATLNILTQKEQEIGKILAKIGEVETAFAKLNSARKNLAELDQLQMQVSPLLRKRINLQTQIDREQASLAARLELLELTQDDLKSCQENQHQLQQSVTEVAMQIEGIEKKRVYLQRVQEKGQERRNFIERLQAQQLEYEGLLEKLEQKLQMLQTPNAICPLCEYPLDEHHWNRVIDKTKEEYRDTEGQLWVVREQIAFSDREIQVLRQEYREVSQQLIHYDYLLERRGQLAAKLENNSYNKQRLQEISQGREDLKQLVQSKGYLPKQQQELQELDTYLQKLNYDEQKHILARNEVEIWRWSEVRLSQMKDNLKQKAEIQVRKPEIQEQIVKLESSINQYHNSPIYQEMQHIKKQINDIGYDGEKHQKTRLYLRKAQCWQLRYQQLITVTGQYPELQDRLQELTASLSFRLSEEQRLIEQVNQIQEQLANTADHLDQIQVLEEQTAIRRKELDKKIAQLGSLEQMAMQLEALQKQYEEQQQQLQEYCRQNRIYQELAQAFGKNGIQTLMIENILPQLEAGANQLLSRLSANQLHVQFVTQKAGRGSRGKKKTAKLIETLDILIADARGTRAYETYSGGEAFRINFAIRLALAKLLAQRAGAALQLLIVDEGFGTQDKEGCDRLISAINTIAPDFACILTVTHMPHLKEAFQVRIEVNKNQQGSQLSLLI